MREFLRAFAVGYVYGTAWAVGLATAFVIGMLIYKIINTCP